MHGRLKSLFILMLLSVSVFAEPPERPVVVQWLDGKGQIDLQKQGILISTTDLRGKRTFKIGHIDPFSGKRKWTSLSAEDTERLRPMLQELRTDPYRSSHKRSIVVESPEENSGAPKGGRNEASWVPGNEGPQFRIQLGPKNQVVRADLLVEGRIRPSATQELAAGEFWVDIRLLETHKDRWDDVEHGPRITGFKGIHPAYAIQRAEKVEKKSGSTKRSETPRPAPLNKQNENSRESEITVRPVSAYTSTANLKGWKMNRLNTGQDEPSGSAIEILQGEKILGYAFMEESTAPERSRPHSLFINEMAALPGSEKAVADASISYALSKVDSTWGSISFTNPIDLSEWQRVVKQQTGSNPHQDAHTVTIFRPKNLTQVLTIQATGNDKPDVIRFRAGLDLPLLDLSEEALLLRFNVKEEFAGYALLHDKGAGLVLSEVNIVPKFQNEVEQQVASSLVAHVPRLRMRSLSVANARSHSPALVNALLRAGLQDNGAGTLEYRREGPLSGKYAEREIKDLVHLPDFYERLGLQSTAGNNSIQALSESLSNAEIASDPRYQQAISVLSNREHREEYDSINKLKEPSRTTALHAFLRRTGSDFGLLGPEISSPKTAIPKEKIRGLSLLPRANRNAREFFSLLGVPRNAGPEILLDRYVDAGVRWKDESAEFRENLQAAFEILHDKNTAQQYAELLDGPAEKLEEALPRLKLLARAAYEQHLAEKRAKTAGKTPLKANPNSPYLHERLGVHPNESHDRIWEKYRELIRKYPGEKEHQALHDALTVLTNDEYTADYAKFSESAEYHTADGVKKWMEQFRTPEKVERAEVLRLGKPDAQQEDFFKRLGVGRNYSPEKIEEEWDKIVASNPSPEEYERYLEAYLIVRTPLLHDLFLEESKAFDRVQQRKEVLKKEKDAYLLAQAVRALDKNIPNESFDAWLTRMEPHVNNVREDLDQGRFFRGFLQLLDHKLSELSDPLTADSDVKIRSILHASDIAPDYRGGDAELTEYLKHQVREELPRLSRTDPHQQRNGLIGLLKKCFRPNP